MEITISSGRGRPKNPYPEYVGRKPFETVNPEWLKFEQSVTEHEAPGFEEGEAEGVLQNQYNVRKRYWKDCDAEDTEYLKGECYIIRKIWRIVPTPEKVEVKEHPVIQRLEKVEQTVAELASLVNELAIAVRKRFESTH